MIILVHSADACERYNYSTIGGVGVVSSNFQMKDTIGTELSDPVGSIYIFFKTSSFSLSTVLAEAVWQTARAGRPLPPPIPPVGCLKNPSEEPSTRAPPRGFFSDVAFSSRQGRGDGGAPVGSFYS